MAVKRSVEHAQRKVVSLSRLSASSSVLSGAPATAAEQKVLLPAIEASARSVRENHVVSKVGSVDIGLVFVANAIGTFSANIISKVVFILLSYVLLSAGCRATVLAEGLLVLW